MAHRDGLLREFDIDMPDTPEFLVRVPVTNPIPVPDIRGRSGGEKGS